jgi:RHS repeat-associated protein
MESSRVNSGANAVHHLRYTNYDAYGNVITQRNDASDVNASETFTYDRLHRLTRSSLTTSGFTGAIDYGYDAVGNLMRKTDYSTSSNNAYTYKAGSNQLQQVALKDGGSTHFGYDAKGNLTRRGSASNALTTENTYNVFNKPTRISRLGSTVNLDYGADLMRYKQVRTVNNETITTYYIDKVFEVELSGSGADAVREETTYLGDMAILIETTNQSDGSAIDNKIRFTHKDRLGSSATFTDHNAQVTTRRSYDPFGAPKGGDWAPLSSLNMAARLYNNGQDSDMPTRRGYTDHEHLDEVEIIHMNGRVYDYNVGRFLSVDPVIVDPTNTQAINPYSYVMNNPLAYTDPSGYATETLEIDEKTQIFEDSDGNRFVSAGDGSGDFIQIESLSVTSSNGTETTYSFSDGGQLASASLADIGSNQTLARVSFGGGDKSGKAGASPNGRTVKQSDGSVLEPSKEDGILSVDEDGVPDFDESHEDFHFYYLDNSCSKSTPGCTLENVRGGLQRYPAPGANGNPVVDEQTGFALPVGFVRHEVSADGGTILNITLPPNENGISRHLLNPGIVRRWVTEDRDNVHIHTHGEGTGPLGRMNELLKHQIWDRVDSQAFQFATGGNE